MRTQHLCIVYSSAGLYPIFLRLVAGRNTNGRLHVGDRHNADWLPAQLRPQLLLDGGKVAVKVDKEPVDRPFHRGLILCEEKAKILWRGNFISEVAYLGDC